MLKKYMCNVTCWVASKREMFTPGQVVYFNDDEVVPSHFTCIEPEVKQEVKVEEIKVEDSKVEKVEIEPSVDEPEKEPEESQPLRRKPKKFGE